METVASATTPEILTAPNSARPARVPASRHDAAGLAAGYTRWQHCLNLAGLGAFAAAAAWTGVHVFMRELDPILLPLALLGGWVLTDFCCGVIHWAGDTWGRTGTPLVGRMLVRSFREHHVDPLAITRHGPVQVLGEQSLFAAPLMALLLLIDPTDDNLVGGALLVMLYTLLVASMAANIFHRWAHMRTPPLLGRLMQRAGLIISYRQHARHHCPPYTRSYCIAIGWLNPLLDRIRFWRGLEWLVWKVTGAIPREDDLGREAALAIMKRHEDSVAPERPPG